MKSITITLLVAALLLVSTVKADDSLERCLLSQMATSDDSITVGQIRQFCETRQSEALADKDSTVSSQTGFDVTQSGIVTDDESAISRRLFLEKKEARNPFALLPHKPNYIMLSNTMSKPNEAPFQAADPDDEIDFKPWETKFQISLKLPVARGLFDERADLFVAYTNRSFWQQFNKEGSAPFRDSNHEPEIWLSFDNDFEILGLKNSIIRTGFSHQSNGQSGELSRSWNRVYADFIFEYDDLYLSFKPWWRVPEDSDNDDNPDIDEYMGNFELGAIYKIDDHTLELLLRNNLNFGDNYGALQLGWSFPLTERVRGYLQWFNGYGESLIDYDAHTNSIGLGIQLSDWL